MDMVAIRDIRFTQSRPYGSLAISRSLYVWALLSTTLVGEGVPTECHQLPPRRCLVIAMCALFAIYSTEVSVRSASLQKRFPRRSSGPRTEGVHWQSAIAVGIAAEVCVGHEGAE